MKAVSTKELWSIAGIAIVSPLLGLAIIVSARAAAVAESEVLLLALALGGAVINGINGFGRRTIKAQISTVPCRRKSTALVSHSRVFRST